MKVYVKFFIRITLLVGMLTLSLSLAARAGGNPRLRVVHAIANGPNADIYVDNQLIFNNIAYQKVADYQLVGAGQHKIKVVSAGAGTENPPFAIEGTFDFTNDQDYTLVAMGATASPELDLFKDNNKAPDAGKVKIRVIQAVSNLPVVNGCIAGRPECIVNNLPFRNASNYYVGGPGNYTIEVRETASNNVLYSKPEVNFEGSRVYTLFIMGLWPQPADLKIVKSTDWVTSPPTSETGAFLSPEALLVVMAVVGIILLAGGSFIWRWTKGSSGA
jgi:hypothetical protein